MDSRISEEQLALIKAAIFDGRKIEAIRYYRQFSGAELKEAKEAIDALDSELRAISPERFSAAREALTQARASAQLPADQMSAIEAALFSGRKIEAVKHFREATGAGLKDANEAVTEIESDLRATVPEKFAAPPGGKGCMGMVAICALLGLLASSAQFLSAAEEKEAAKGEWRQLFNGKDTAGWEHVGGGGFEIEDGLLKTKGGMGLLWYKGETFENCVIRVVYKATHATSNGGVFVRVAEKPTDAWYAVHHGYEIQICDTQDEFHRTGAVYSLSKSSAGAAKAPGEWNTFEITLKGAKIIVVLNGTQVNEFDPVQPVPERTKKFEPERGPRPEKGYIGIQNHDDYSKDTNVYYKEISVKKL